MSLKAFHIVFIAASILLAFAVAGWAFGEYRAESRGGYLAWGIVSALAGVGLTVYGRYFLKKLKRVSYL